MKAYIFQEFGDQEFFPVYRSHKFVSSRAQALKLLESRKQELESLMLDDQNECGVWRLKIVRIDIHPGKQNMLALLNDYETVVSVLRLGQVRHYSEGTYKCEAYVEIVA